MPTLSRGKRQRKLIKNKCPTSLSPFQQIQQLILIKMCMRTAFVKGDEGFR